MATIQEAKAKARFPAKLKCLFVPEKARYRVLYGGRGGSKSWNIARALLLKGCEQKIRVLCAREYQTSIKDSVHKLLCDQIFALGIEAHYEITERSLRGNNGTEFIFVGVKNNTNNVKSIEGIDICWVEEAQSVTPNSWNVLVPTIRKADSEIWISFNPELPTDETWKRFVISPPENAVVQKINWSDNPYFPEVLDLERRALQGRDIEAYNNVWEGIPRQTVNGAIFAKEVTMADLEGRICNVPYDASKPVHAVFDLGWADQTACWILQFVGQETRLIRYFEDSQQTIGYYLAKLQSFGYLYDTIWLPHDAKAKSLGTGKSIEEIVRASGMKVQILGRVPVADSINAARTIFNKCYFDRQNTEEGLQCLRHYRYDVDPDTKMFSAKPLHDEYSHGADAFRYIGLMINEPKKAQVQKSYRAPVGWMG
ncbi:Bacteriophage terminase, large subunit [uncultured Caudovirales phage]|uniref:Bacteriophage terminase, large subunit n=1 Tax=uncultured Caudovirales phage TaxID=2100421 RepID=A0A6J5QCI5_9CAUD|nr:Bacteriophage terminase, large subunit [uncultured Caudovirales phage]CAB4183715.1 Bacteriophage terminase, large subunit [uncultured Caudovirales phage]CAB4202256.1 Bacteriophage terminase, large subunit [uncultured Caudovirales phage]CAB4215434.1 Bacteriophage terminase, large subunit [uncultured Caudovirales phage]CAB5230243.1 Bacteriophage terminase, large subunit [uncultured Caudovirales phage]